MYWSLLISRGPDSGAQLAARQLLAAALQGKVFREVDHESFPSTYGATKIGNVARVS